MKKLFMFLWVALLVGLSFSTQLLHAEGEATKVGKTISTQYYYIDTNEPYDPGKERTGFLPDSVKDIDFYVEVEPKVEGEFLRYFNIVMDNWTCKIPIEYAESLKGYIEHQLKEEDHETIRDTSGALLKDKQMHSGDSIWAEDLVVKATSDPSKVDKAIVVINRVRMDGDFYVVIGFIIRHYCGIIFPYHELGWLCLTPKKAKQLIKVLTAVDEHYKKGE